MFKKFFTKTASGKASNTKTDISIAAAINEKVFVTVSIKGGKYESGVIQGQAASGTIELYNYKSGKQVSVPRELIRAINKKSI